MRRLRIWLSVVRLGYLAFEFRNGTTIIRYCSNEENRRGVIHDRDLSSIMIKNGDCHFIFVPPGTIVRPTISR